MDYSLEIMDDDTYVVPLEGDEQLNPIMYVYACFIDSRAVSGIENHSESHKVYICRGYTCLIRRWSNS